MIYYLEAFRRIWDFEGRSCRAGFGYFLLGHLVVLIILNFLVSSFGAFFEVILNFYGVFALIPLISVTIRRLHDMGESGWKTLLLIIPIINLVFIIVLLSMDSKKGENKYGANPKGIN